MVSMLTLFRCFTDGCAAFDGTPLQVQPECVRIHQNAYEINCKWTIHIILGEMNRVRIWGIRMLPYGSMPTVWEATPYINLNHSPAVLRMYGWIHRVRVWPSLTPQKHPKKKSWSFSTPWGRLRDKISPTGASLTPLRLEILHRLHLGLYARRELTGHPNVARNEWR